MRLLLLLLLSSCVTPEIKSKTQWAQDQRFKASMGFMAEVPSRYTWTTQQCISAWKTRVGTGAAAAGFAAYGSGSALGTAFEKDRPTQIALGVTAAGTTVVAAILIFVNKSYNDAYSANCVQESK